eukprot:434017-Amphidinium_carterae.1
MEKKLQLQIKMLTSERTGLMKQLKRAGAFCYQVTQQALNHQNQMIAEARELSECAAMEREEMYAS